MALVVYTGKDTKLILNQGKYKFSMSRLSFELNLILTTLIFFMILMNIISA
jgi:hypothetical protein